MNMADQALIKLKKRPMYRYGLFNYDSFWGPHWTKKSAREAACEATGEPWKKTREDFQIRKVKITLEEFEGRPR